ncbi:MAG: FHA domain-containing protein [Planctomycetota bacterium]|jgi:pSer/pThr/pTyr-binding forkhead associated (FHA) protein
MPKLTYTDADGAPAEHIVRDEPVTIGRSAECDIRLSGEGVGRLHAVVEPSGAELRVRDQDSREGTWVNDEKVADALLGDGDEFRVGGVAFKVTLGGAGASSRRSGAEGEGEDGERRSSRRVSRRPQREILGGIRLSKTQQTIIKIVCAAVMALSALGIMWLINYARNRPVVYIDRKTYVDPQAEPKKLIADALELARSAREAEQAGNTGVANELIQDAKGRAEKARDLITALDEKHPGPTYWQLHELAADINKNAATISSEAFRLEMQAQKSDAGGD